MGVDLKLTGKAELFTAIEEASDSSPVRIATPNPEFILLARENSQFKKALEKATHHVVDGFGLSLALRVSGSSGPTSQKYAGIDLVEDLFKRYSKGEKSFALVGGYEGAAAKRAELLRQTYPHIKIVAALRGGDISTESPVDPSLLNQLETAAPDILMLGFGAPKQELWMASASASTIPVMIGVGGSLNFASAKKRAPKLVQVVQMEWLWRAFTEKGHAKRAYRATVGFTVSFLLASFSKRT
jgi:N-acetylglucosaminyldiphosphoundecaprenol N-acetyl-beta-D-mannosaminyltransferase